MRGSDDTSVRFCVRPVLSRVLGTLCTCIPLQHLLRGGLLLVFSSHDILNTRDDALSAPPSGRIVLLRLTQGRLVGVGVRVRRSG